MKIEKSASNNDVGIIAKILLFCATPCFEVLTKFLEYQLKANMIKTILKDYHWLRQQLHLPENNDEIVKLETGDFMLECLSNGNADCKKGWLLFRGNVIYLRR